MKLWRAVLVAAVVLTLVPTTANAASRRSDGLMVSRCGFSHRANADPIVHPEMAGMSHSHDFFGNTGTDASSTTASLQAGRTTCRVGGDRAAYWAPTMYASGVAVRPSGMLAYYSGFGERSPQPLPIGLKVVAGKDRRYVRFACFAHGMPRAKRMSVPRCGTTELLGIGVRFPDCWNGRDLDSDDHRSHMAYSEGGVCPASHPVAVARLWLWLLYPRQEQPENLTLASGDLSTAHADFFNGWVANDLTTLQRYCIAGRRSCYKDMWKVLPRLGLERNPM